MNGRTLGTVVLVLGVLVAVNPLYLGLWTDAARLSAGPVSPTAVDAAENATVVAFEDLPRHSRLVVDRTIEKGRYTILGPSNRPDEFAYPSGFDAHPAAYYVERDGSYYRVLTDGDAFGGVYLVVQFALVGLGALVAFVGRSVRRGERGPVAPAVGGVGAVVLTALGPPLGYPGLSTVQWSLAVVGIAGMVALGATLKAMYAAVVRR